MFDNERKNKREKTQKSDDLSKFIRGEITPTEYIIASRSKARSKSDYFKTKNPGILPFGKLNFGVDEYFIDGIVGEGKTSVVYSARYKKDIPLVIKSPSKEFISLVEKLQADYDNIQIININELFEREAEYITKANHPNVISNVINSDIHSPFEFGGYTHIPLEPLTTPLLRILGNPPNKIKDSDDKISKYHDTFFMCLTHQVEALDYIHNELGIVHRDIKPGQFVASNKGTITLCDFAFSDYIGAPINNGNMKESPYFPKHISPETVHPNQDLYAFGKSVLELSLLNVLPHAEAINLICDDTCETGIKILEKSLVPKRLINNVIKPCIDSVKPGYGFTTEDLANEIESLTYIFTGRIHKNSEISPQYWDNWCKEIGITNVEQPDYRDGSVFENETAYSK